MMYFTKSVKILLSLVILVGGLTFVDREIHIAELPESAKRVAKAVDPRQLLCLAENIFYEAGHEGLHGQAAVARVVMNRVRHGFASTPCGVVHQKTQVANADTGESRVICQFSWTCEETDPINPRNPRYQESKRIAYQVLAYDAYDDVVPSSTLFFHNTTVDPGWKYYRVGQIGNHIFYSKKKVKKKTHE